MEPKIEPQRYYKKPVPVYVRGPVEASELVITAHGRVRAEAGDYILTDVASGDTWPIKPDFFAANYTPERVPSSPAAPDEFLRGLATAQEVCQDAIGNWGGMQRPYFTEALSRCWSLLEHVKTHEGCEAWVHCQKYATEQAGSPAAPTPPQWTNASNAGKTSESSSRTDVVADNSAEARKLPRLSSAGTKFCPPASPCGEIVAKGVCDYGPSSAKELHEKCVGITGAECINWRHTHNVCLGCGREEPV